MRIRFRYVNHRDDEHEYTVEPQAFTFKDGHWQITGLCLERDGESRRGPMQETPIRSFVLVNMQGMEEVAL